MDKIFGALIAVASAMISNTTAVAAPPIVAPVEWPPIVGYDEDGEDALSGIACGPAVGDRRVCALVDDEQRRVRFATLDGRTIALGPDMAVLDKETTDPATGAKLVNKEADLEAVARDGDVYWVLGSHGTKRHLDEGAKDCPPDSGAAASLPLRGGRDDRASDLPVRSQDGGEGDPADRSAGRGAGEAGGARPAGRCADLRR